MATNINDKDNKNSLPQSPTNNLDVSAATYLGGNDDDFTNAVDISVDGNFVIVGGSLKNANLGGKETEILDGGDGTIVRYDAKTNEVVATTRLPGKVLDLEVSKNGDIAVAYEGGIAVLNADATEVKWNEPLSNASRIAISDSGTVGVIEDIKDAPDKAYLFDSDGQQLEEWSTNSSGRHFDDIAVTDQEDGMVITTGYDQKTSDLKVAFTEALSYEGENLWNSYNFSASEIEKENLMADTEGLRVAIGRDGQLYAAYSIDGGTGASILSRDPNKVSQKLTADREIQTDKYNTPNKVPSAKITWYGRYNLETGNLIKGQSLLGRNGEEGNGNSVTVDSITATEDGTVILGGSAAFKIANRDDQTIEGQPVSEYTKDDGIKGYDAYLAVISPDLKQRISWTPIPDSDGAVAASRDGKTAVVTTTNFKKNQITHNAIQDSAGGKNDGYLLVIGGNDVPPGTEIETPVEEETPVNTGENETGTEEETPVNTDENETGTEEETPVNTDENETGTEQETPVNTDENETGTEQETPVNTGGDETGTEQETPVNTGGDETGTEQETGTEEETPVNTGGDETGTEQETGAEEETPVNTGGDETGTEEETPVNTGGNETPTEQETPVNTGGNETPTEQETPPVNTGENETPVEEETPPVNTGENETPVEEETPVNTGGNETPTEQETPPVNTGENETPVEEETPPVNTGENETPIENEIPVNSSENDNSSEDNPPVNTGENDNSSEDNPLPIIEPETDNSDSILPGLIDLRNIDLNGDNQLDEKVTVEFSNIESDADYNNSIGYYTIANIDGAVEDILTGELINPGEQGYAEAALNQRVNLELRRDTGNLESALDGGALLLPFLIANGTVEEWMEENSDNQGGNLPTAYFSFASANPDRKQHIRQVGNELQFEDLFGGGDNDFNDFVTTIDMQNAV